MINLILGILLLLCYLIMILPVKKDSSLYFSTIWVLGLAYLNFAIYFHLTPFK